MKINANDSNSRDYVVINNDTGNCIEMVVEADDTTGIYTVYDVEQIERRISDDTIVITPKRDCMGDGIVQVVKQGNISIVHRK